MVDVLLSCQPLIFLPRPLVWLPDLLQLINNSESQEPSPHIAGHAASLTGLVGLLL